MANRLSSVQSLLPVMRPASAPLWCKKTRGRNRDFNLVVSVWSQFIADLKTMEKQSRFSNSFFSAFLNSALNLKRQHFLSCFIQCSRFSRHIVILPSFDISLQHHPKKKTTPNSHRNTLLCVFECAARHLSTPCSHLVPLGLNMIMVVVNLFAEEAFAAKGA